MPSLPRRVLRAALTIAVLLLLPSRARAQQQGSFQLSSESQLLTGNAERRGTEPVLQPDFGFLWTQPGTSFGDFSMETLGTRRGDAVHLGRTWLAFRNARTGRVTWSAEGGDLNSPDDPGDYQFSNLPAPPLAFTGGLATARTARFTWQVMGGRTNALRNIFGSDPEMLDQSMALTRLTFKPDAHWTLNARGARTRTSGLDEFTPTVDASAQEGGGVRWMPLPSLQFVADGSYVRYRATGAATGRRDYSYIAGAHALLARGSVQVNATRFSPGDLPVLNAPLQDRSGVFVTGEYDLFRRARVFGGWESVDTNINPSGAALRRPQATSDRGFGGVRLQVSDHSTVSVRIEDGGRVAEPLGGAIPIGDVRTVSDTGAYSVDWQGGGRRMSAFARVSRRDNVDVTNGASTFTQDQAQGQIFLNVSRETQIFGGTTVSRQREPAGSGTTFVELTGGAQQQIFRPGLWFRGEMTASRNHDLTADLLSPRQAFSLGLNGGLTRNTMIGVNVYVDRAPIGFAAGEGEWLTRSTIRITHTIPTGSVRLADAAGSVEMRRAMRGSGTILGTVYADWNGNGVPDPGEELLAGIPIRLGAQANVTTAGDGQFAFTNVPAGSQQVGVDLNALPVAFDPPEAADVTLDLARGTTRRVAFGLVPLGSVRGRVIEDANKNGLADPGEPGVDKAVLTLDRGERSELARTGSYTFDAVRAGAHRLELLQGSLPDGAVIVGGPERPVAVTRDRPDVDTTYLVQLQKRPEVRKVFPPKIGARTPGRRVPDIAAHTATRPQASREAANRATGAAASSAPAFTIQVAALNDQERARALVADLKASGFAAYLLEPGADQEGPFRVRVGRFGTRAQAERTAGALESHVNQKMWVTRESRIPNR